jgi:hypothetical protein
MPIRCILIILLFLCLGLSSLSAQMMPRDVGADSVTSAVFPVISYDSNEGLIGGVLFNRYDYRGNMEPFNNYIESSALVSTKGFIQFDFRYEKNRALGLEVRSLIDLFFHRYPTDYFFGIGNNTTFSNSLWEDEYYYFESIGFGGAYRLRNPVYNGEESQFDLMAGIGSEYNIPYIREQESSFAEVLPNGTEGGWVNMLNTGFIWENRDSEFDPHTGNRAEFELRFSPDLISTYALTTARLELRQYFYLFNWLTVANRVEARTAAGNVPFWELSSLGNRETLRGYPLNRFRGNSSVAYNLELRAWVLKFPEAYDLKFGGHVFSDFGRVFTGRDDFNDLFEGYKQTVGIGGAMSIFHPDFIFRGEIGFSEDVSRIYIGIGYVF